MTSTDSVDFARFVSGLRYLTLKIWDTSTSAFDIAEATENFTLDGSNLADDTLTSDNKRLKR